MGLALLLAAVAGYVEHRKNVAPHLKLEQKRTYLFGYACDEPFAELRRFDPTARMNVMELDSRLPGQEAVFRTVYALGMDEAPDADLGLRLSQGVCGRAVSQGEFTAANLEVEDGPTFGLSADQLQKTRELTLVLSLPIKKTESLPDGTPTITEAERSSTRILLPEDYSGADQGLTCENVFAINVMVAKTFSQY